MDSLDPFLEQAFLGIAHALFMNRLHVLRLTEIVRLQIRPDAEDGTLNVPPELDEELRQQAIDFVLTHAPRQIHALIHQSKESWLQPA